MISTESGGFDVQALLRKIDLTAGTMSGSTSSVRRLSDLRGCFADTAAYEARVQESDDVIYWVASAGVDSGDGALDFGLGTLLPGRIGDEYFLTKGHYHSWREAAEVYVGLSGQGGLVLEQVDGPEQFVPLAAGEVCYVPGSTAHRTVNTGEVPFTYLGIYPAEAGHDYASLATSNFRLMVASGAEGPEVVNREDYLRNLARPVTEKKES